MYFSTPDTALPLPSDNGEQPQPNLQLTTTESEILKWLATGMSNKQIAITTDKSTETVKTHIASILKKLQCKTRTQAVTKAVHFHLI